MKRLDDIYSLASDLKAQSGTSRLSVMGIGGSKHTVEHMLAINGLNLNGESILFYSDVDSISFARFLSYTLSFFGVLSSYMLNVVKKFICACYDKYLTKIYKKERNV